MTDEQRAYLDALRRLQRGSVDVIISSPPFGTGDSASAQSLVRRTDKSATWLKQHVGSSATEGYGEAPGQMAELKIGDLDALLAVWEGEKK